MKNSILWHHWPYQALRNAGKIQKANKGHEGHFKGHGGQHVYKSTFLLFLGHIGVKDVMISIF